MVHPSACQGARGSKGAVSRANEQLPSLPRQGLPPFLTALANYWGGRVLFKGWVQSFLNGQSFHLVGAGPVFLLSLFGALKNTAVQVSAFTVKISSRFRLNKTLCIPYPYSINTHSIRYQYSVHTHL